MRFLIPILLPVALGAALPALRLSRRRRSVYAVAAVCLTSAAVLWLLLNPDGAVCSPFPLYEGMPLASARTG